MQWARASVTDAPETARGNRLVSKVQADSAQTAPAGIPQNPMPPKLAASGSSKPYQQNTDRFLQTQKYRPAQAYRLYFPNHSNQIDRFSNNL